MCPFHWIYMCPYQRRGWRIYMSLYIYMSPHQKPAHIRGFRVCVCLSFDIHVLLQCVAVCCSLRVPIIRYTRVPLRGVVEGYIWVYVWHDSYIWVLIKSQHTSEASFKDIHVFLGYMYSFKDIHVFLEYICIPTIGNICVPIIDVSFCAGCLILCGMSHFVRKVSFRVNLGVIIGVF